MALFKNDRASLIELPNGKQIPPDGVFELEAADLKNPSVKIYVEAGYIVPLAAGEPPKVEEPKEEKPTKPGPRIPPRKPAEPKPESKPDPKAEKIAAVAKADGDALLKLSEGETDPDVKAAIEKRAAELVG